MRVCTQLSKSVASVRTPTIWSARSGCLIQSPRGLAKFLLQSAAHGQVKNGQVRVKLVLTHEDIAQLTGTCRETITRTLSEFRQKDIVELKGSTLTINNKPA